MKKLLGIGVLLLVGSIAYAESFKPTGTFGSAVTYYGQSEHEYDGVNNANNGMRIQHSVAIDFSEKTRVEARIRDHYNLTGDTNNARRSDTESRVRVYQKHDNIDKITTRTKLEYRKRGSDSHAEIGYQMNFKNYALDKDFVKTTDFTIMPRYRYTHFEGKSNYVNTFGVDVYTNHALPLGFSWENNIYLGYNDRSIDNTTDVTLDIESYVRNSVKIFELDKLTVRANFEGGLDAYSTKFSSWEELRDFKPTMNAKTNKTNNTHSIYMYPNISATMPLGPINVYASTGIEYRNWVDTHVTDTKDFTAQLRAETGFTIKL